MIAELLQDRSPFPRADMGELPTKPPRHRSNLDPDATMVTTEGTSVSVICRPLERRMGNISISMIRESQLLERCLTQSPSLHTDEIRLTSKTGPLCAAPVHSTLSACLQTELE